MNLTQQIRKNQATMSRLTTSMTLLLGTPHAQNPAVRARINNLQEATLVRLQELEIEGQKAKIESMTTVVDLLKDGLADTAV